MPESHPLSQEDIDRLGRLTGLHCLALPEDFCGEQDPVTLENIAMSLGMEAIGMTETQPTTPEGTDD